MKKSELIKLLQTQVELEGDLHLLHYKISDEGGTSEHYLFSPTRRCMKGPCMMNKREFREYINQRTSDEKTKPMAKVGN